MNTSIEIPGLNYFQNFISKHDEQNLIAEIDNSEWNNSLKRRVQHYGFEYNYKKIASNTILSKAAPIPNELEKLQRKIEQFISYEYDQLIINEYLPGQGISSHVDCIPCFDNKIAIISLLSGCTMEFKKYSIKKTIFLEANSLLVISDEARYNWKHAIIGKKSDQINNYKIMRQRRVSCTFRKVSQDNILENVIN